MVAVGAGLGPLMLIVAFDTLQRRERLVRPLVLPSGFDHGGEVDVVVLVGDRSEDIESAAPDLSQMRPDIGLLTLASVVDFEVLEAGVDDEAVRGATGALVAARDLPPVSRPALVVSPGKADRAMKQLARAGRRTLFLDAVRRSFASAGPQ